MGLNHAINRRRRNLAACFLLGMLLLRAYVPVGFMPAGGSPFLLELCPAAGAMPMDMSMDLPMDMSVPMGAGVLGHQHGHFEQCPFGSAPAAGPLSQFLVFEPARLTPSFALAAFQSAAPRQRQQRAHPPRGPPSLA